MFCSTLDGDSFPYDLFEDDDRSWVVVTPIAYCDATDRTVAVDCRLLPGCDIKGEFWEFVFQIAIACLDGTEPPFYTQQREIARNYIPEDVLPKVMEIACSSLSLLLTHVRPVRLYRVTKARNPPEKALRKHHLLTETLLSSGYAVAKTGTDFLGRMFWECIRND